LIFIKLSVVANLILISTFTIGLLKRFKN